MSLKLSVLATLVEIAASAIENTFGQHHTIDRDCQGDVAELEKVLASFYEPHATQNYPAAQINGQITALLQDFNWQCYVISPSPVRCSIGALNPITMNAMYSMLAALHALKKLARDDAQVALFDEMLGVYATAFQLMNIIWGNTYPTVVSA